MMFKTMALISHLTDVQKLADMTLKKMYDWIKLSNADNIKFFIAHYKDRDDEVVCAAITTGAGDLMYLPAGWSFFEKTNNADLLGVKMQFISKAGSANLKIVHRFLMAGTPAPNATLQAGIDMLNTMAD